MTVLAIDPGRTLGWALSDRTCGTVLLRYDDDGAVLMRAMDWIADIITAAQPSSVVIERPFFGRMGGNHTMVTVALYKAAHAVAWRRDLPRRELGPQQVWLAVYGQRRKPSDGDRMRHMRARGWDLRSDHAADAAALLEADEARRLRDAEVV